MKNLYPFFTKSSTICTRLDLYILSEPDIKHEPTHPLFRLLLFILLNPSPNRQRSRSTSRAPIQSPTTPVGGLSTHSVEPPTPGRRSSPRTPTVALVGDISTHFEDAHFEEETLDASAIQLRAEASASQTLPEMDKTEILDPVTVPRSLVPEEEIVNTGTRKLTLLRAAHLQQEARQGSSFPSSESDVSRSARSSQN